jgi:uncharacterized protein
MDSRPLWKPSLFNMLCRSPDGTLLIFNSLSGALVQIPLAEADYVIAVLNGKSVAMPEGILSVLAIQGILTPDTTEEVKRVHLLHQHLLKHDDHLHLVLMPTEKCNLRCVYCYEDFRLGRMSQEVVDSIIRLVQQHATNLRTLSVSWFGGEPLIALDVVEEMSHQIIATCKKHDVGYSANMTTNGYLLTKQAAGRCLSACISKFQVTLDGPAETHNTLRVLANGNGTFETILDNLRNMRDGGCDFHVRIRVNFSPTTAPHIPTFIGLLGGEFGGDPRFSVYFRGIGAWGGAHNRFTRTCDQAIADIQEIHFMSLALEKGFRLDPWRESMQLLGSVCYAANPRSFVIGSDGRVYKCTIAFHDPRNQIGRLTRNGRLDINEQLHRLWTSSEYDIDADCKMCAFRPACLGNSCPLGSLSRSKKQCPALKICLNEYLPLLATEALTSLKGGHSDVC